MCWLRGRLARGWKQRDFERECRHLENLGVPLCDSLRWQAQDIDQSRSSCQMEEGCGVRKDQLVSVSS